MKLELLKEPDGGGNAETGSSNPVINPKPRAQEKESMYYEDLENTNILLYC